MNYFYDVLANYQNKALYNFYEWENNDSLTHIKKIPIFKVKKEILQDFYIKKIRVDNSFLQEVKNKALFYENDEVKQSTGCILSDSKNCLIVNFNNKGLVNKKSVVMLEDDLNVIEITNNFKFKEINYELLGNWEFDRILRKDIVIKTYFLKLLKNIYSDEIKYIYYELYSKKTNNIELMKSKIELSLNTITDKHYEIYNLLNLIYKNSIN